MNNNNDDSSLLIETEEDSEKYKKEGSAGRQGSSFEQHIILLALLHCIQNYKNKIPEFGQFRISTQNGQVSRAFDDVIIEYSYDARKKKYKKGIFLQAKQVKKFKTTSVEFFPDLPKYLKGFLQLRRDFAIEHLIIYSNYAITCKAFEPADPGKASYSFLYFKKKETDIDNSAKKQETHTANSVNYDIWKMTADKFIDLGNGKVSWHNVTYDENDFREFFSYLVVISEQPEEATLLQKFRKALDIFANEYDLLLPSGSSHIIKNRIDKYYSSIRDRIFYLNKKVAIQLIYSCFSAKKRNEFDNYNQYNFNVTDLPVDLPNHIHLSTKATTLYVTAVCKFLEKSESNKEYLLTDGSDILNYVINAFNMQWFDILVIFFNKDCTIENEYLQSLKKVKSYKRIIVIGSEDYECVRKLKFELNAPSKYKCVTPTDDTFNKIWSKPIKFQNREVSLSKILNFKSPGKIGEDLLNFIMRTNNIRIVIGPDLPNKLDKYMMRRFEHLSSTGKKVLTETELLQKEAKFIVISGLRGIGRSTILTHLAIQLKNLHPHMLVINLSFSDILPFVDKENFFDTIVKEQIKKNDEKQDLHSEALISLICHHTEWIIVLDGFENVPESADKRKILNMLKSHANSFKRCIISTHDDSLREIMEIFEDSSDFVLCRPIPLIEEERETVLTWFWKVELCDRVKKYAKAVMNLLLKTNIGIEILGVPLHIKMISKVFKNNNNGDWEGLQQFLNSPRDEPKLDDSFDIVRLYEEFVDGHIDWHLKKYVKKHTKPVKKCVLDYYTNYAFHQVMSSASANILSQYYDQHMLMDGEEIDDDIGLFRTHFKHRNIAEYFVVKKLDEMLWKGKKEVIEILFKDILAGDHQQHIMRNFMNLFFKRRPSDLYLRNVDVDVQQQHRALYLAAIWGNCSTLRFLLKSCSACVDLVKNWTPKKSEASVPYSPLMAAAFCGHLEVVQFLIEEGEADVNVVDGNGNSALHYTFLRSVHIRLSLYEKILPQETRNAIENQCEEYELMVFSHFYPKKFDEDLPQNHSICNYLLNKGANTNTRNISKFRPLHYAIFGQNINSANEMTQRGAKAQAGLTRKIHHVALRHTSDYGKVDFGKRLAFLTKVGVPSKNVQDSLPVLHLAALEGDLDTCKFLINRGADVKLTYDGKSVLHRAVECGSISLVSFLIENNASIVDIGDSYNRTPLHIAVINEKLELCKTLLKHRVYIDARDAEGKTALHYAADSGTVSILEVLLEGKARLDIKDNSNRTPILSAAHLKQYKIVEVLLKQPGVKLHEADTAGNSIMHYIAEKGTCDLAKLAVLSDTPVNMGNIYHRTPLHTAIVNNNVEVLDTLLRRCDLQVKDGYGQTVLHLAALTGKVDIIEKLLEAGVPVNIQNTMGCTPLHLAASHNRYSVCVLFINNNASITQKDNCGRSVIHYAVERGSVELLDLFVKNNINEIDNFTCTPLHYAAYNENISACNYLLANKADLHAVDNLGRQAIHYAAEGGCENIVTLLNKYSNTNIVNTLDKFGFTPLHLATINKKVHVCRRLIELDADLSIKDNTNKTALDYAKEEDDLSIINLLTLKNCDQLSE